MTALPGLDQPIAYPHDDGEHLGGGHCLDLLGHVDAERWRHILEQQLNAFIELARRARTPLEPAGAGYEVTRPLLFLAHHVCEVAIKAALVTTPSGLGRREHDLSTLWRRLVEAGGTAVLTDTESTWGERFVAQMHDVTPRGFDGRYADETAAESSWCCLHLGHLESCVTTFAGLMRRETKGPG